MNIKFDKIRSRWDVMTTDSTGNSKLVCWVIGTFAETGKPRFTVFAGISDTLRVIPQGFVQSGADTMMSYMFDTLWESVEYAKEKFKL